MTKLSTFLFSLSLLNGCSPAKQVLFKTYTFLSASKVKTFEMAIPRGVKYYSRDLPQYVLKKYEYQDSAVLYISLDISYGHSPNKNNWITCSRPQEGYKCEGGQQADGRYWRELLSNNVVVGYFNVKSTDKARFDTALNTLRSR